MFKSLKQFAKKLAGGSKRTRKVSQKGGLKKSEIVRMQEASKNKIEAKKKELEKRHGRVSPSKVSKRTNSTKIKPINIQKWQEGTNHAAFLATQKRIFSIKKKRNFDNGKHNVTTGNFIIGPNGKYTSSNGSQHSYVMPPKKLSTSSRNHVPTRTNIAYTASTLNKTAYAIPMSEKFDASNLNTQGMNNRSSHSEPIHTALKKTHEQNTKNLIAYNGKLRDRIKNLKTTDRARYIIDKISLLQNLSFMEQSEKDELTKLQDEFKTLTREEKQRIVPMERIMFNHSQLTRNPPPKSSPKSTPKSLSPASSSPRKSLSSRKSSRVSRVSRMPRTSSRTS